MSLFDHKIEDLRYLRGKGWIVGENVIDRKIQCSHPNFHQGYYTVTAAIDAQMRLDDEYDFKNIKTVRGQKLENVLEELRRSIKKHGNMGDPVEGLHTLKCEIAELEREMMRTNKNYKAYRDEMIQVAAMGLKLLFQCGDVEHFDKIAK